MNEVHHRSPSQSLLNRMENMGDSIEIKSMYTNYPNTFGKLETYDNDTPFEKESFVDEPIETSWSFQYASYPYTYAANEAVTFLGKCYLLGEELMPLLVNLKGVVEQKEFFQRDNYLMLVSIRRSLVSHVEELHSTRKMLKHQLQKHSRHAFLEGDKSEEKDVSAVLEKALLSLGRCVDLVRPAGLLLSTMSKSDWKKALKALQYSMNEIHDICDPDRPLCPTEWGKLVIDVNKS